MDVLATAAGMPPATFFPVTLMRNLMARAIPSAEIEPGTVGTEAGNADLVVLSPQPFCAEATPASLVARLTAGSGFFVRTNFNVPTLDPSTHTIDVGGAVARALTLSVADLRGFGLTTIEATLECAGNGRATLDPPAPGEPWRVGAVSTARWTGVPLARVLERGGLLRSACDILIEGADWGRPAETGSPVHFARALPRAQALAPETLLALEMNGTPLTPLHGAPVRLLVPGWYGMASVKWVARIVALPEPYRGYFQTRRYIYETRGRDAEPVQRMRVKSLITNPLDGSTIGRGPAVVRGWAWSGTGVVTRVEVAIGSGPWQEARLLGQPERFAWRGFELEWRALAGRHTLRSRATDASGAVQPDAADPNRLGYGNNAIRTSTVEVLA
jgi:DMSO/TMAO reductase YedYZ molybdopterin-dependent catalytic subunit